MQIQDIDYGLSGIYKIIFDNNKMYIGLSNDIRRRMIEHFNRDLKRHPNLLISKAIKKHNVKDIEIIEFIDENDREKLKEREKYWIKYYNTYNIDKGYNMTLGGDGASSGIYNNSSKISQEELDLIFNLLLNSSDNYEEIADKTSTSRSIVSRINNGVHYRNNNYEYPLRKKRIEKYELNNKHSLFYGDSKKFENLINDLKNTELTYIELSKKYNIGITSLSLINQGKKYAKNSEQYPLRPVDKGKSNRRIFSEKELIIIKKMLEEDITMVEIANQLKCDRKVISDINNGKRQPQENWNYPLRKKKLKTGPKTSNPVSTILGSEE